MPGTKGGELIVEFLRRQKIPYVTRSEDFAGALEQAVEANRPYLIDVHVDAEVRSPATGAWALPPVPHKEPVFGERYVSELEPAG